MIKCKSNKCLLIHVCSPNLITFCLFMRLLGGWGLPRTGCRAAAARAGAGGYSGIRFLQAGTNPPEWKSSCPGGRGPVPALRGVRMPAQVQRGCGRPGPHPPPPVPAPCTPLLTKCLPKAWRGERPQGVFSLMCTAGHLKNSLAIPRVYLLLASEFFFLFTFFIGGGAKPQNYFLAIFHQS